MHPHFRCAHGQFHIYFCTHNPFQTYSNQEHCNLYLSVCVCVCGGNIIRCAANLDTWYGRVKISSRKLSPCHTTTTKVRMMKQRFWKQNHFEGTPVIPMLPSATYLRKPQISHTVTLLDGRHQNNPGSSTTMFAGSSTITQETNNK